MTTLMNDQPIRFGEDYETCFDLQQYIQRYTDCVPSRLLLMREQHKLCSELKAEPQSLTVLDIGTGPCIAHAISVAIYASKIILSDYAAVNRAALTAWLENQEDACNWMACFKKIVTEIEGKSEMEVERRVTLVREKVKAVVPCDITKDPPIPEEYMCQYDIVQSSLCLQAACRTKQECFAGITRMASLVKRGGKMALFFVDRDEVKGNPFYPVGSELFFSLAISKAAVVEEIKNAGFCDLHVSALSQTHGFTCPKMKDFYFVSATKE